VIREADRQADRRIDLRRPSIGSIKAQLTEPPVSAPPPPPPTPPLLEATAAAGWSEAYYTAVIRTIEKR
jgi:hypothetical protein